MILEFELDIVVLILFIFKFLLLSLSLARISNSLLSLLYASSFVKEFFLIKGSVLTGLFFILLLGLLINNLLLLIF